MKENWTGDSEMLIHLEKHGVLAEAEQVLNDGSNHLIKSFEDVKKILEQFS
jgi:hypothetical protein